MERIRIIATDLDGTLLRKDKGVSAFTRAVLQKCRERGYLLMFATARPPRAATHLHIPVDYIVGNNGATVTGKGVDKKLSISGMVVKDLVSRCIDCPQVGGITLEMGDYLYSNGEDNSWANDADWRPVHNDFSQPVRGEVYKISVECSAAAVMGELVEHYPMLHLHLNHGENWSQIMHKDASKLNGIRAACQAAGLSLEQVLFFGDDYNDLDLLREAGQGVAVGNAVLEAKEIAGQVCGANEEDGVALFLHQYLHLQL